MGERNKRSFCVCITTREYVMYDEQGKEYDRKVTKESRLLSSDDTIKETKHGFVDRDTYLQSAEWQFKRQMALQRDHFTCQKCGTAKNLNVHHLTYANFGREKIDGLITLCKTCHEETHENDLKETATTEPTNVRSIAERILIAFMLQNKNEALYRVPCVVIPSMFNSKSLGYLFDCICVETEILLVTDPTATRIEIDNLIDRIGKNKLYDSEIGGKKGLRKMLEYDLDKFDLDACIELLEGDEDD